MGAFTAGRTADGRIRTAQIIGNAALGGVAACALNYYRHADRSFFCSDFFTYGPSRLEEELRAVDPDARVFYLPPLDRRFWQAVPRLTKLLKEGGYALVHSHMTTLSAFALYAAKRAGAPVRICHAHSTFDKDSDHYRIKALLRPFAAKYATGLMACGKAAAENLYRGRAEEAYILPNAIDLARFSPPRDIKGEAAPPREVLFVGRFVYQKNLPFLLRAFARARQQREMRLTLAGDGADRDALLALSKELKTESSVRILPPCDPAPLYREADLFVLPSRYEGLPVVALEAQAAGLPCLFSDKIDRDVDVCGNGEFLPLDEEAWARALNAPRRKSADGAEKLRAAHYDIRTEGRRLSDYYREALAGAGIK